MPYSYRGLCSVYKRRVKRGRWSSENTSSYNITISFSYFFYLLSFYLTIIIATPFNNNNNNNNNSFININNFDLEDKGADVKELNDYNTDLILLLLDTPLETIKEEDKEDNRPKLGLKLKKG
jgi:hypothetical protein